MNAGLFEKEVFGLRDLLYRLAIKILGNVPDAEDAVQQLMLKMWQKKDELNEIENLSGFIVKSLKNDCLNRLKKTSTTENHFKRLSEIQPSQVSQNTENIIELVKKEIAKLPEKQRIIMQLSDVEGLEAAEIGEILDMDSGAVRTNLSRARKTIKAYVTKITIYEKQRL